MANIRLSFLIIPTAEPGVLVFICLTSEIICFGSWKSVIDVSVC
jgi:hypothetical protein